LRINVIISEQVIYKEQVHYSRNYLLELKLEQDRNR